MNEYAILSAGSSAHTAFKAEEDPVARVLITTEKNGEIVNIIGTNPQEVAGWRRYFDSDDWDTTRRSTDTPLELWARRSENTMNAKRGNLDAEGDDVALEAAEDIRDALEAQASEPTAPGQIPSRTQQPPEEEPTEDV